MQKIHLKSGDLVKVIAGKDKGKTGKIMQVFPRLNRIVVDGVNLSKRHLRSRRSDQPGDVVEFSMPIHASNVLPVDEQGKTMRHTRVRNQHPKTESL